MEPLSKIDRLLLESAEGISDPEERAMYLDRVCHGNPSERARLEELLEARKSSESFFDFEPLEACEGEEREESETTGEESDEIGLRIGRYRLIRRLGEGGYGVVYLAEQETPVRRQVALKLIRVGLGHEDVIARFETERQSLAMMDHPGIARVFDAGTAASGHPFFVMQWVVGEKITDFCNKQRLTVSQRLELFIKVCHAVQHAHQKGVIHRDLKPSNVLTALYDGVPRPKVIDFGIAKATGAGSAGMQIEEADHDYIFGTPNYMSPEQGLGNGMDVDTRADIFSLGVMLCELLTGRTPFGPGEVERIKTIEFRRNLMERKPMLPSAILETYSENELATIARERSCEPAKLRRSIKGDLDAIVMKCLQKDRQNRYGTANGLAIDIQRHLEDRPVIARSAGAGYHFAKTLRRNKLAFLTGTVVFSTLAAGFGVSTWLFMREKKALREQSLLRQDAEMARLAESRLRQQAEAREACANAAVLVTYDRFEEADRLLASIPDEAVPSSLEAAETYKRLGYWHVRAKRWQQAAERFTALVESQTSIDPTDSDSISYSLLPAIGAIYGAGDWQRYERVRKIAIERFAGSSNPVVAEQILKATLTRPVDSETLRSLSPLAELLEKSMVDPPRKNQHERYLSSWACFALALWHFRNSEFESTEAWAAKSLDLDKGNPVRVPTIQLVLAMTAYANRHPEEARYLLSLAADPVRQGVLADPSKYDAHPVLWLDWIIANTLLNEAMEMIGELD